MAAGPIAMVGRAPALLAFGAPMIAAGLACASAVLGDAESGDIGWVAVLGTAIWLGGFLIEAIADEQKWRFRRARAGSDGGAGFITTGLWSRSHHPNYFGEILMWLGFSLLAVDVPTHGFTFISPIIVFIRLRYISIPAIEKFHSRSPDYKNYYK